MELLVKAVVSGLLIAVASEAAKRSSLLGAILISLPLTSIIALAWIYADTHDAQRVVHMSWSILWIVAPSLVFFAAVPALVKAGLGAPAAIAGACAVTAATYAAWVVAARALGVDL